MAPSGFTLLHLSDLHFGAADRSGHYWNSESTELQLRPHDRRGLLGSLVRDLAQSDARPDMLVVTGDLLDRGSPAGVDMAVEFLRDLCARLDLPIARLVLVPGNHDVLRADDPSERYTSFDHIWRALYGADAPGFAADTPPWLRVWRFDYSQDLGVEVFGFNSCEGLTPTDEHGSIGTAQRDRAEELLAPTKRARLFRIAAMHHHLVSPVGIVRDDYSLMDDAGLTLEWLAENRFHLVLHGHQHVDWDEIRELGGWAMTIAAAGSAGVGGYGRKHWMLQLGYQVVRVHDQTQGTRVRREYDPQRRTWVAASKGDSQRPLRFGQEPNSGRASRPNLDPPPRDPPPRDPPPRDPPPRDPPPRGPDEDLHDPPLRGPDEDLHDPPRGPAHTPVRLALLRRTLQFLEKRRKMGVALIAPLGFDTREIADEVLFQLDRPGESLLPVRLAPDLSSAGEEALYAKLSRDLFSGLGRASASTGLDFGEAWREKVARDTDAQRAQRGLYDPSDGFALALDQASDQLATRQRTLLILLDDLAQMDEAQRRRWGFLMNRFRDRLKLLVWGGYELYQLIVEPADVGESSAFHHLERVNVGPLSLDEVTRLLSESVGPAQAERIAPTVHGISGGHPALIHDVIALPVQRLVHNSLDALPEILTARLMRGTHMTRLRREIARDAALCAVIGGFYERHTPTWPQEWDHPGEERLRWLGVVAESDHGGWSWVAPVMRLLARDLARLDGAR